MTDYSDETNALIVRIQIASPDSRATPRLSYAREAWDQLDADGQVAAVAAKADAIARVCALNKGLIVAYAARWKGACNVVESLDDLIRAAECGYIASLYKFDITTGYKHSTYATWAMQNEIVRELNSLLDFGQPDEIANAQRAVRRVTAAFEREHGRRPSVDEVAQAADLGSDVVQVVRRMPELIAGDGYDDDDDTPALETEPAPETTESRERANAAIRHAVAHIGPAWDEVIGTPLFDTLVREGANEHTD